jgi:hypothetical protein
MEVPMNESKVSAASRIMLAVFALALGACIPGVPLDNRPCPCATGWVCCATSNVCAENESSCPGAQTPPGTAGSSGNPGSVGGSGDPGTAGGGPIDASYSADVPLPPPAKIYRLVQTRNVASPLPDPTGIASDGSGFWILSGGQNSASNTLVHFNVDTGVTDHTFRFQNLIEVLGTGAYGVTWDGAAVWISVSGNTNKLVLVDPASGQIRRTMSSPTDLGPSDLDFDGINLWLSSGTGKVFVIDPVTGGIQRHFPTGARSSGRDNGVAYRAGEVWVGDLFGGMEIYDPNSGALLALAVHEDGTSFAQDEVGSSCFVGPATASQLLVIASHYGITYYRIEVGG